MRTFNIITVEKEIDLSGVIRAYAEQMESEGLATFTLPITPVKAESRTPVQPVRP